MALVLTGLFVPGSLWYLRWSDAQLPGMAEGLGEIAQERAARDEAAGALEAALAHYQRALAGRFHGPQNRNHCEKRAGVVLMRLGRYAEALPHLQRAQTGPHRSLNGYGPLAETLLALDRDAEARAVAERWRDEAGTDPRARADAAAMLGRIAYRAGDYNAAREAYREADAIDPGHASQAEWARMLAEQGDLGAARAVLAAYLAVAESGDRSAEDWDLLVSWSTSTAQ
ncbi:MAG: hypothetical protein KF886_11415 [Candidatus Hydrogenedentes bacterium]|nr:hypothetical protein [Candidatus Hydrogenedentota bacterium]